MPDDSPVWLVDDNEIDLTVNRRLVEVALSRPVRGFRDGASFLEALEGPSPQSGSTPASMLILLDIMMPDLDGFAVLERIEALPSERLAGLTVFMLSATLDPAELQLAESHPLVEGILEKPLDVHALRQWLASLSS
jgi:CheY-like chemotaxis protein